MTPRSLLTTVHDTVIKTIEALAQEHRRPMFIRKQLYSKVIFQIRGRE